MPPRPMLRGRPSPLTALIGGSLLLGGCVSAQVVFTAEEPPGDLVIAEIEAATTSVHVAIYTFTLPDVTAALREAHDRGLEVLVVADEGQSAADGAPGQYTLLADMERIGVPVCRRSGQGGGIMHHKFTVIDGRVVLTGSFNYTLSANTNNSEDLIQLVSEPISDRYEAAFEELWTCDE